MKLASLLSVLMFASFNASSENIGKVTWSPNRLNIEVEQGDEKHIGVLTSSSERLTDLSVQIVPELKGLLTTEPVNLKEQSTTSVRPIWFRVHVPEGTDPGTYFGTVHLKMGNATISKPLPVSIKVLSVARISSPDAGSQEIRVSSSGGSVTAFADAAPPPPGLDAPFTSIALQVTDIPAGSAVRITLKYPTNTLGYSLYKIAGSEWIDISSLADIQRNSISYTLIDGGSLDADGSPNGTIIDPVTIAQTKNSYSSSCNPVSDYSSYVSEIGENLKIPVEILSALMLQESMWLQFKCNSQGEKTPLVSYDGGIGLMQVTCKNDSCPQGRIVTDSSGNSKIVIDTLLLNDALKKKLQYDWKYNIQVGAKILLAKKAQSDESGAKNPAILENWYYPLARYNGYQQWNADKVSYCEDPGPYNDPAAPCYSRNSLASVFNRAVFPYQELIYSHVAGYSSSKINPNLRNVLPKATKVTLPGPYAVCKGAGKFKAAMDDFAGGVVAVFDSSPGGSECGDANSISAMLCEASAGLYGTVDISSNQSSWTSVACVHAGDIYPNGDSTTLPFSDNFNDNNIDTSKWIYGGNSVKEINGELQVTVDVTDQGGWARTIPIKIDRNKPLTLRRSAKIYAANNYFDGGMIFKFRGYDSYSFGISYANYSYSTSVECAVNGFSVFRNNANPHVCADQRANTSGLITPIWAQWFDEEVRYNPATGQLQYYTNGLLMKDYDVGVLPTGADTLEIYFSTWGWWTGHYQYMNYFELSQ